MKTRLLARMLFAIMLLCSIVWATPTFARQTLELSVSRDATAKQLEDLASYGLRPGQLGDFQRLVSMATGQVEATFDRTQRIPSFVKAEILFPPGITQPEEQGYHFFEQFRGLYGIRDPRKELRPTKVWEGRHQNINIRYEQYYEGIRVVGAEMLVHVKSDGKLWFVQGKYVPDINISTVPLIESAAVLRIVESDFVVRRGPDIEFTISPPDLGILNPWVYDRTFESKNLLIWVAVATEYLTARAWTYHIDAQTGEVLSIADSRQTQGIVSRIWDAQNNTNPGDDVLWFEDDAPVTPPPPGTLRPNTVDLNAFVTGYWTYLRDTFQVYSLDSRGTPPGMQIRARAYYDNNCQNAWWDPNLSEAQFCPGFMARDIASHELTHGLVHRSAGGLEYHNQSGALNESFADVFSEFVDCWAGNCTWIQSTLRDLSNPLNPVTNRPNATNRGQQPDHIGFTGIGTPNPATDHPFYHLACNPTIPRNCNDNPANDFGGVHSNSGIPNIVAYLIANGTQPGDPHYNYHIRGLKGDPYSVDPLTKPEMIYYNTLVDTGLTSTAEFLDARNVMNTVCQDFANHGTYLITPWDCNQVQTAWASVGVGTAANTLSGQNVWGNFSYPGPYFITGDATVPAGKTLTFWQDNDVYFLPNTKITVPGLFDLESTYYPIRLLSSRSSKGNTGIAIYSRLKIQSGGQLKMPVEIYSSTDTRPNPIILSDGNQISSFIRIDENFTITDVNVTLNITHTRDRDLTVTLFSPDRTSVQLFTNVAGIDFTDTTLDDQATTPIGSGTAPFTGSFLPQNALSAFNGRNPRGYWELQVMDPIGGDTGTLRSWSLTFNQ